MQRQIIVMFCLLLGLAVGQVGAQTSSGAPSQAPNRGALFKIEQGGHTTWLFGTIHVGAPDFYPLEPRVLAALEQATALALEVDPLGDQGHMMAALREHGMYRKGHGPASAEIGRAYRPRLARLLRHYGLAPQVVAPMKPWLLASLLTVSEFAAQGYQAELGLDAWLARQAHARKLPVVELESAGGQMALFGRLSAAEQVRFLEEGITAIEDQEYAGEARAMAQAWRTADVAALDALAHKAAQDTTFSGRFVQRVLLDGRNPQLADGIAQLLAREGHSFAAIGILHLVGTGSVPEILRRRGLAVERIY